MNETDAVKREIEAQAKAGDFKGAMAQAKRSRMAA